MLPSKRNCRFCAVEFTPTNRIEITTDLDAEPIRFINQHGTVTVRARQIRVASGANYSTEIFCSEQCERSYITRALGTCLPSLRNLAGPPRMGRPRTTTPAAPRPRDVGKFGKGR